jgi:M6 family metalloprotease-like protein
MKKAILLLGVVLGSFFQWAAAQTSVINGLTVIVNYSDYSLGIPTDSIAMLMNQPGFNSWNCHGSVKDFYYVQSNSKVSLNSTVIEVSLPQSFHYYHDDDATSGNFIPHIASQIAAKYPNGFQNLSLHPETARLHHFNIISRGSRGIGVAYGTDGSFVKNNNQQLQIGGLNVYNVTGIEKPTVNTICHEVGHSVFGWTDYYRTNVSNLGDFCVMASAGTETPMPVNPALRYIKGWTNENNAISATTTQTYTVTSNSYNQVFKYTNPNNPKEYLIIAAHMYGGYYQAAKGPDQGLGIYYVDEDGGIDGNTTTPNGYPPLVHLIQADGQDELQTEGSPDVRGDSYDLFDNNSSVFSSFTHPFRWKNGNETGLTITNISAVGPTMQFTVQARNPNTVSIQTNAVNGGSIYPSGLVEYSIYQTINFAITPNVGYVIDQVYFDGAPIGTPQHYAFTGMSGAHALRATFKRDTTIDAIPAPWAKQEIGTTRRPGVAGYRNGVFGIESGSYDIWNESDGLNYVYQSLQGDGQIVAHIKDMNKAAGWSKAGIMMRETLSADSKHLMIVHTPQNAVATQLRSATGGSSVNNPDDIKNLHFYNSYKWLKITREGNSFKSYCSNDTINWVYVGGSTINMGSSIYVGLCAGVGSDQLNTIVTFDYVKVTKSAVAENLFTRFGIPRNAPLPTTIKNFKYVYSVGSGGPNLSNVSLAVINWDLPNNGLWQFSLQTNNGAPRWYTNIPSYGFNSFGASSPKIYIDGSMDFPGFSGFFFANTYNTNDLVLVNQSGAYAVIFTNTPPAARTASDDFTSTTSTSSVEISSVVSAPNPFTEQTTVSIPDAFGEATITVLNASGIVVETKTASKSFTLGDQYAAGLYLVKIASDYKTETIQIIKAH